MTAFNLANPDRLPAGDVETIVVGSQKTPKLFCLLRFHRHIFRVQGGAGCSLVNDSALPASQSALEHRRPLPHVGPLQ